MARQATKELTVRQKETLQWIKIFIARNGLPPTVREIGKALGIESSTTFNLVRELQKKGYVKRGSLGARSLSLTVPDKVIQPTKPLDNRRNGIMHFSGMKNFNDIVPIPLLGDIAAGHPILAEENRTGEVLVSSEIARRCPCFALTVRGDSMIDAGINNGDIVIARRQPVAENGDIIVALLGDEATVKQLSIKGDVIELKPNNPAYRAIPIGSEDDFQILGKVIAATPGHGSHIKRRN